MYRVVLLLFLILIAAASVSAVEAPSLERRAAIDVGSGSTKVTIADVDIESNHIVQVVFEDSYPVPYQEALEHVIDGNFDDDICALGLRTFEEIKGVTERLAVDRTLAVATAAFREAGNGETFASTLTAVTGIPVEIISQKQEGALGFFNGVAATGDEPQELVVWDIGTGSFQVSTLNDEGNLLVSMGGVGSVPFRQYLIDVVQQKDSDVVASPNPLTLEDAEGGGRFARFLGRKTDKAIREKITHSDTRVVGVGNLFNKSLAPMGQHDVVTIEDLCSFLVSVLGKSDEEVGHPFAASNTANAVLALAFMKALEIDEVHIAKAQSSRGLLLFSQVWQ